MWKTVLMILGIAAVAGVAYFFIGFSAEVHRGDDGRLQYVKITPRTGRSAEDLAGNSGGGPLRPTIRIATFDLGGLDERKLRQRRVSDVLIQVISQFDVAALQGIRDQNQGVLSRLVEWINTTTKRHYSFAVCPTVRRDAVEQYSAFVFDTAAIEIDQSLANSVEDISGRFRHKPLVALFRVRGPDAAEAFTFKLINVDNDPRRSAAELDLLDDVYRAVRDDGREEDDVIVLGNLGAGKDHLGPLGKIAGITSAIAGVATTTRGLPSTDNILFDRRATVEFTGRCELMDLIREFDLTIEGALEVSDQLPIWAEFSSFEGGQTNHMAGSTPPAIR